MHLETEGCIVVPDESIAVFKVVEVGGLGDFDTLLINFYLGK